MEIFKIAIYFISFFAGLQISIGDIQLLKGNLIYKLRLDNCIAYICILLGLALISIDIFINGIFCYIGAALFSFGSAVLVIWVISRVNSKSFLFTLVELIVSISILFFILDSFLQEKISIYFIIGFYYRNNPFGAPFIKKMLLLQHMEKPQFILQKSYEYKIGTTDYTYAGKKKEFEKLKIYNVTDYGIKPNTHEDVLPKVQQLIDSIGKSGGIVYFPKGRYYFNKHHSSWNFLRINSSHTHIQGEIDETGKPVSTLINCNATVYGKKNPWLSPFFITTGEELQASNIFWGLQFLKKKDIVTKSASMSDPGSDGIILTPEYCTDIIKENQIGDDVITVSDTDSLVGCNYIMIGLYDTSTDGNLIKDILGVTELRPEWGTAYRAGEEQAPSYQWLVGIDRIIDKHKIKITRPFLRNVPMKYTPKIFKVEMLEDIEIRDIKIESKWNGLFRHHGYPRYYSIKQAQEMDYGWNCINMKRVAHGRISNVIIQDFTNPLYLMDSRNITVEKLIIRGADGHQGIKLYENACDNLIKDVVFYNHYADMMGGEGNAYGNVFDNIAYCNPYFKPVDFDFHGFSEGPMSPPSHNLFININSFRFIKGAGALYNQPACAQFNVWKNWAREGCRLNAPFFINIHYNSNKLFLPLSEHNQLFKNSIIENNQ